MGKRRASSSDDEHLMPKAFPLGEAEDISDGPPTTGEEYLRQVR
jgi:hypothetical protein